MASFAPPSSWTNKTRDLAGANEIVLAYSERNQALGGGPISLLSAGDNDQDAAYWSAIQSWCEANCGNFVDHVNGPLTSDGSAFLMFTLDSWRAAAGLPAGGFRRCVARNADADQTPILDTTFGVIQGANYFGQPSDYRGVWNFEDLQKALGALKWTLVGDGHTNIQEKRASTDEDDPAHFATMTAAWPGATWHSSNVSAYGLSCNEWSLGGGSHAYMNTWRWKSQYALSGLAALNAIMDIYIAGNSTDVDGIGFTVGQLFAFLIGKTYSGSGSFVTTEFLGDFETYPWTVFGVTPNYSYSDTQAFPASWAGAIAKWVFSNS